MSGARMNMKIHLKAIGIQHQQHRDEREKNSHTNDVHTRVDQKYSRITFLEGTSLARTTFERLGVPNASNFQRSQFLEKILFFPF